MTIIQELHVGQFLGVVFVLKIAPAWQPNHDDGVQITAAKLWLLFRHKPWQKILKETWAKLEKGRLRLGAPGHELLAGPRACQVPDRQESGHRRWAGGAVHRATAQSRRQALAQGQRSLMAAVPSAAVLLSPLTAVLEFEAEGDVGRCAHAVAPVHPKPACGSIFVETEPQTTLWPSCEPQRLTQSDVVERPRRRGPCAANALFKL